MVETSSTSVQLGLSNKGAQMKTTLTRVLISGSLGLGLLGGAATTASAGVPDRPKSQQQSQVRIEARFANLTDAQRNCLVDAGLTRPPSRPTGEQRKALGQAATDCGIDIRSVRPTGARRPASRERGQASQVARFGQLTAEQGSCLTEAGLTRPTTRPTSEQRRALGQAAADCGIEIPAGAGGSHRGGRR